MLSIFSPRCSEYLARLFVVLVFLFLACGVNGCNNDGTAPPVDEDEAAVDASVSDEGRDTNDPAVTADVFQDVTVSLGIDFVHRPVDHEQQYFMPRIVGSGAAFVDFDADGLLDLYFVQNNGQNTEHTNRLYRQLPDGNFQDVSIDSGLAVSGYGMGVACGDVNNDGRVDILLNEYGRARLMLNNTKGSEPRFEDVTESAGIDNRMWGPQPASLTSIATAGLDVLLVNYVTYDPSRWCADGSGQQDFCGPDAFQGRVTKLYRNLGKSDGAVGFADVTITSGLGSQPGPGLGVYCADFDGDGFPDVFVANDGKPNHLWINQRDGTFREEAVMRGVGYNSMGKSEADMGIAIGDVDGNGLFDIFVTHLSDETHTLWSQGPRGEFIDRTATTGLTAAKWRGTGFGTVMVDVDNDGDQDLLLANGRVTRESGPSPAVDSGLDPFWHTYAQRDQILLNRGDGSFADASLVNDDLSGVATVSRGMATADFNNDGAMDLLVTRVGAAPALLLNRNSHSGHWLGVRAVDPKLNRDAYGSEVIVVAGDRSWTHRINPGYSYLCSNDHRAHFGLGPVATIDAVRVVWPDGVEETFTEVGVDQHVTLLRGAGKPVDAAPGT